MENHYDKKLQYLSFILNIITHHFYVRHIFTYD